MTNDPHNPAAAPQGGDEATSDASYEPGYSEPSYETTSGDSGAPWQESGSAAPSHNQQPHGASGAAQQAPQGGSGPGQQAPFGAGSGQPYQGGPPMGGMPQQPYGGGYAPMATGPNNPNWLAGPSEQGHSTLQLDYWLSVFFAWIPALVFFLTERDKNQLVDDHTKELLNFNITRMIVYAVMIIPIIGWILGGLASLALFVIAIMGALKGPEEYKNGRTYRFPVSFRFIK